MSEQETITSRPVGLITGGTRGIGLGCAQALVAEGWDLALNGIRDKESVQPTLDALSETGAEVHYCQGDVSNTSARKAILDQVRERFGRLNLLLNNAGVSVKERVDLLGATEESWDRVIGANLKGPYFLAQAVAKWLIEQKEADPGFRACIINMGSVSTTMASTNRGEYCVAKAGLGMATKVFASRLGEKNIPVYEVRPGVTRSDMTASPEVTAKYDKLIDEGLAITKRWGTPEDVGKAVAALCRGDFPYSTGSVFMVDGGMTVPRL